MRCKYIIAGTYIQIQKQQKQKRQEKNYLQKPHYLKKRKKLQQTSAQKQLKEKIVVLEEKKLRLLQLEQKTVLKQQLHPSKHKRKKEKLREHQEEMNLGKHKPSKQYGKHITFHERHEQYQQHQKQQKQQEQHQQKQHQQKQQQHQKQHLLLHRYRRLKFPQQHSFGNTHNNNNNNNNNNNKNKNNNYHTRNFVFNGNHEEVGDNIKNKKLITSKNAHNIEFNKEKINNNNNNNNNNNETYHSEKPEKNYQILSKSTFESIFIVFFIHSCLFLNFPEFYLILLWFFL